MLTRVAVVAAVAAQMLTAQARRPDAGIDVQKYTIEARIDPEKQTLAAKVKMEFTPDADATEMTLGFHQGLDLRTVTDGAGDAAISQRLPDSNVRVSFPQALPKGKPATLTFEYDGKLTGNEESPVWGIKFAAIHEDNAYFMYPARWFPVNDYTVDRFSMDLKVTVPTGFNVAASGLQFSANDVGGERVVEYEFTQSGFPGSFAVMKGNPQVVNAGGINGTFFFRDNSKMSEAYGQELGKAMEFFTGLFGLPRTAGLHSWKRNRVRPTATPRRGWSSCRPQPSARRSTPVWWRTRSRGSGGACCSPRPAAIICGSRTAWLATPNCSTPKRPKAKPL